MSWPFGNLQMFKYGGLLIDPPWPYEMYSEAGYHKAPEAQYSTMSKDDLLKLPIDLLAGRDCILFMWYTWPHWSFACELIAAWKFRPITGGVWLKRTQSGKLRMGTGYQMRTVNEPFVIARFGDCQRRLPAQPNAIGAVDAIPPEEIGSITIEGLAREHSRKPPEARDLLTRMTPQYFRAELFAREAWDGNEVWGNEADKFSGGDVPSQPKQKRRRRTDEEISI